MSLFGRLGDATATLLTIHTQLETIKTQPAQDRQAVRELESDLKRLYQEVVSLRERVTRLETARENDRSQLQTEISRFKLEVERAVLKLNQGQVPSAAPDRGEQ